MMEEAKQREAEAIKALTSDQFDRASVILSKIIAADQWEEIWEQMRMKPKDWYVPFHFGWGMWVRNQLRAAGFGDKESKSGNLDDIYIPLVEFTAKKLKVGEVSNDVLLATAAKYIRRLHDIPAYAAKEYDQVFKALAALDRALRKLL